MLFMMDELSHLSPSIVVSPANYYSTRAPYLYSDRRCIEDVVSYQELSLIPLQQLSNDQHLHIYDQ
jgi:hypothetical protein